MTAITFNKFAATTGETSVGFVTKVAGADRKSNPITIDSINYNENTKSIELTGSDGITRKCRVERLEGGIPAGRALWKQLLALGQEQKTIKVVAAGGFDPNTWFYRVEEV